MIDSLKLSDETATAIVGLAISFETFTDDMPETEKDRLQAAHDTVAYAIDAYVTDNVRSDSDDEDRREAGEQVEAILKVAGVEVDEDDDIEYGKPLTGKKLDKVLDKWDVEIAEADEEEEEEEDGDEAAFEIDDIIDGYEELTPASKIKAIKKLDLDPDDEDDAAKLNYIADWENEQDKPASRVLSYIEELLGEEEGEEEEPAEEEEPQEYTKAELNKMEKDDLRKVAEKLGVEFPKRLTDAGRKRTVAAILEAQEEGEGEEPEADTEEEPWEGYDESKIKDIKAGLEEAAEDEDDPLTVEQLDYTVSYEEANQNREGLLKWMGELREELDEGEEQEEEEPEEEEEEEEKPAKKRPKAKKGKKAEAEETTLTISLNGDKLGEFDAAAVLAVVAAIADMVESGSTKLSIDMS